MKPSVETRGMQVLFLLIILMPFQNCGALYPMKGTHESMTDQTSGGQNVNPAPTPKSVYSKQYFCNQSALRGVSDTTWRRLSRDQFENSLRDIFGSDVVAQVGTLPGYPADNIVAGVKYFQSMYTSDQTEVVSKILLETAAVVVGNRTYLNRVAPACVGTSIDASNISDSCLRDLISRLGGRIQSRVLSSTEVDGYLNEYKTQNSILAALPLSDRLEVVISRLLQSPNFLYHRGISKTGVVADQGRIRVDAYTIAKRISYRVIDSVPDAELLSKAQSGALYDMNVVEEQTLRLMNSTEGRKKVRENFIYWLHLNKIGTPLAETLAREGLSSDAASRDRIRNEMLNEVRDFAEYVIYEMNGRFEDLIYSDLAFPKSADMAKVLNTGVMQGSTPQRSTDGRRGILMRPALMLSSGLRESPVGRGVRFRLYALCDVIPPPPPNADQANTDALASLDLESLTTRQIATATTMTSSCIGCHAQINSIGFAMARFSPVGKIQNSEKVYSSTGQLLHEFPLDSASANINVTKAGESVRGFEDLNVLFASSNKIKACLSRQFFAYSRMREPAAEDNCQMSEMEDALGSSAPVKETLLKNVASEEIFWMRLK